MWRAPRVLQSSAQPFHPPPLLPPQPVAPPIQHLPKVNLKFSRRYLSIYANTSLLLLSGSHILDSTRFSHARAEENPENLDTNDVPQQENPENPVTNIEPQQENQPEENLKNVSICPDQAPITKRAFLDISINGKPAGRIIVGLYGESVPIGATRFSKLASGAAGVSYRRKEFIKIMQNYVQHSGVRSYGVDAEMASKTGSNLVNESLVNEWEKVNGECLGTKNVAGSIGIIVRDPLKPPPKIKLVARGGKLVIDEEEVGKDPNGSEFVIATKDSPEMDASTLVVGRVLEGMEVVEKIGQVETVKENTTSPYFRVAKLIGDKRAVVAERGFNRPYAKVIVTNCGLME